MTYKNQDNTMYGTKIYNYQTKEVGLLIFTWTNEFADGDVSFATCVDQKGKKYDTEMDNIIPYEDLSKK
jgi:hypothetical protein